jgi:AcrR family transcriptional regulator
MASAAEAGGESVRDGRRKARYRKLKPRPGRAGEEVAGHQRARLYAATIELVDELGYEELTVTGIARAAGVSNRTFYENFSDKEDCFSATYELIVRHAVHEVLVARQRSGGWQGKLRAGFRAFVREVSERPKAARLALVEAFKSQGAFRRMRHTSGLFETLVAESFTREPREAELPPLVTKGIVAGVTRIARARLLAGEEERLAGEADDLMRWAQSLCSETAEDVCPGSVRVVSEQTSLPAAHRARAQGDDQCPDDERAMILAVAARLAAEEGYAALSVPRIRTAAGISRRRFEEHFDDVPECFMAALEMLVGRVLVEARSAYLTADYWPRAIHRALTATCREVAADPVLVRLVFFELYVPAGEAVRWRADLISNLCSFLRASAPADQRPSVVAAEASMGAVWAVLHHYSTTGRAAELPRVAETLSYLVLAPAIGAEAAAEVIRAEEEEEEVNAKAVAS